MLWAWQVRLSSAEERATKAVRERKELVSSLERQLAAARAEILDWRRELAAAEADRDRLATDRKALAKRASSGSLYAGYGGTPKARGAPPQLGHPTQHAGVDCCFIACIHPSHSYRSCMLVHVPVRPFCIRAPALLRGLVLVCRRRQPARSGGRLCRAPGKWRQGPHGWCGHCVPEERAAEVLGFTGIRAHRAGDLAWPCALTAVTTLALPLPSGSSDDLQMAAVLMRLDWLEPTISVQAKAAGRVEDTPADSVMLILSCVHQVLRRVHTLLSTQLLMHAERCTAASHCNLAAGDAAGVQGAEAGNPGSQAGLLVACIIVSMPRCAMSHHDG